MKVFLVYRYYPTEGITALLKIFKSKKSAVEYANTMSICEYVDYKIEEWEVM